MRDARSFIACLAVVCLLVFAGTAQRAEAVVVTTSVGTYDVTTAFGTYNNLLTPTLESQAWWDDATLADEFAEAVGLQLGLPNLSSHAGPVFATGFDVLLPIYVEACVYVTFASGVHCDAYDERTANAYYAVAAFVAPVPAPATLPLLATGFALVALSRRRK